MFYHLDALKDVTMGITVMELHLVKNSLACIWESIPQMHDSAYSRDVG